MSLVFHVLEEEYNRLKEYLNVLEVELKKYPKGSLSRKVIRGHVYYYLAYRQGGTVKFDYIGKEHSDRVKEMGEKIQERKSIQDKIREAKKNLKDVKRALHGTRS